MELHQIEEKLRWYEAREAILKRISPELNSVIDIDKFLIATVQELGKMMGVDKCDFIVPGDQSLRVEYEYRKDGSVPSTLNLRIQFRENGWEASSIGTIVVNDAAQDKFDERLKEILTRNGTRSFLCIPVVFQDELLGILGFHHCKEVHKWSDDEINFLKSLTQQTSIALQYTRLYTRMEKEVEITKTLLEITNEINSKVDFSEITSFVLRKAVELLDATYGSIGILDTAERKLSITTFYPEATPSLRNISLNVSLNAPYYDAILDKKTVGIFGEESPGDSRQLMNALRGRSAIINPIVIDNRTYGTLNLVWDVKKDIFKPHEVELVSGITSQMAVVLEKNRLSSELILLKRELTGVSASEMIVGVSKKIEKCVETALSVIDSDVTILVQGETGTGKELIADLIQKNSNRKDKPYIKINCGAIPETLIEAELFGYEKGAFTDAKVQKIGKFEIANGGTIFLDEVGELSLNAQVKLLRVLQNGELFRIGGNQPITVHVRVIAATNIDLEEAIRNQRFRSDLFYRLNVFPIVIPPLRERKEDIPLLAHHFLEIYKKKSKKLIIGISDDAMKLLKTYDWPGNIRELENITERAVITCTRKVVTVDDLPKNIIDSVKKETDSRIV
ncbi:MAG TPA: sigma 54-interacting transcriptional regulator, partial [Thermodesulfobacteriota bacterium]|nr:sigma 54-interacting transcriptional regulator [Thermodesulfobacteriota bacterium]